MFVYVNESRVGLLHLFTSVYICLHRCVYLHQHISVHVSVHQVVKSSSRQAVKPSSRQAVKPSSRQAVRSSSRQVELALALFELSYGCMYVLGVTTCKLSSLLLPLLPSPLAITFYT